MISLFVISIVIIFLITGYFLQWQLRANLDKALGQNLESIAATFALKIDPVFLLHLQPGDEDSRTYHNYMIQLEQLIRVTGVKRVFLFNKDLTNIIDSDSTIKIGQLNNKLKYNQQEIEKIFNGFTANSILFTGQDGNLYKTGYAPVKTGFTIIAGLGVEGSASMLDAVTATQKLLFWLGLIIIIGAIILGSFFANRITTPLKKLELSAEKISDGHFYYQIPDCGKDEVGFLSKTMEQMRINILQRDKRQQAMLAGVAHEIRNPLGGIELFSGLLANEIEEKELKNYAEKILKETKNLNSIIQSFLIYAKPSQAIKTKCSVKSVWKESVLLAGELGDVNIQHEAESNDFYVNADPQHLKQIFLNLIKNSNQAMNNNGTIFVKMWIEDRMIKISIADTGPGIPQSIGSKVFEPFFTTREKGSGLGLAVVKNMIEENDGLIWYDTEYSNGAKFIIALPGAIRY